VAFSFGRVPTLDICSWSFIEAIAETLDMENARVSLSWQGAPSEARLPLALVNTGARLHVKGDQGLVFIPHPSHHAAFMASIGVL